MNDATVSIGEDNFTLVTDESLNKPLFYKSKPKEGKSRLIKTMSLTDRVLQSLLSYTGHEAGVQTAVDVWYKEQKERCKLLDERAKLEFFYSDKKAADTKFEESIEAKILKLSIDNIVFKLKQIPFSSMQILDHAKIMGIWADNKPELIPYSDKYLPPEYSGIYEKKYIAPKCDWCSAMLGGLKNPEIKITKMKLKIIPIYAAGSICQPPDSAFGFAI